MSIGSKGIRYEIDTINGKLTACEFAEALGVAKVTVSRLFNLKTTPSPTTARNIAALLDVSMEEVYSMFPGKS